MTILEEMLSRLKGDVARVRLFERERVMTLIDEAIMGNDCSSHGSLAGSHTDAALRRLRDLVSSGRPGSSGAAEGNEAAVGAEAPAVGAPDQPGRIRPRVEDLEKDLCALSIATRNADDNLARTMADIATLLLDMRSDQRVRPGAQAAAARLERWLLERSLVAGPWNEAVDDVGAAIHAAEKRNSQRAMFGPQDLGRNAQEGFGLREEDRKKQS